MQKLVSIEEARTRILAEAKPQPTEACELADAFGRVLGEEIVAPHSVPPFDNSAMDGFAVRAMDTVDAGPDDPVGLKIAQTIPAGSVGTGVLGAEEAAKIMTGAPMPAGSDAVVQVEVTEERDGVVLVFEAAKPGRNVRKAGEDVTAGERVLRPGSILTPA